MRCALLQSLVVFPTLVTFKAEDEDAAVAAALLVLLPAPTPSSPLQCRAGVAHIMALACGLHGAPLSGCGTLQLGALVPYRFAVVLFVVAAVLLNSLWSTLLQHVMVVGLRRSWVAVITVV